MLMKGVYYNGNGGYQVPGENVYHVQSECPTVRQHSHSLNYLSDVTEIELCGNCRRIASERNGPYYGQRRGA
jgi:hypothetical protein